MMVKSLIKINILIGLYFQKFFENVTALVEKFFKNLNINKLSQHMFNFENLSIVVFYKLVFYMYLHRIIELEFILIILFLLYAIEIKLN